MRKKKEIGISTFLKEENVIKNKTADLDKKNISIIDKVSPFICSQIAILNLQNNHISSLKGIQQFVFVTELNLLNNRIMNCRELQILKNLSVLKILYIDNNPFLNEPLEQNILELLMDKETDIEILSFQVLATIKQIEEDEIKIIFLSNYLNKINLHEQLKQKALLENKHPKISTVDLISKIIPQFYTIIEDPNINSKIKKEAITIKKNEKNTIEQAVNLAKINREDKVKQLVKNIIMIIGENSNFSQNETFVLQINMSEGTINFSPQKNRQGLSPNENSLAFSPVRRIGNSKYESSIEEITLTNTKQFKPTKPQIVTNNTEAHPISHSLNFTANTNSDAQNTNRKTPGKKIAERLKKFNQNRSNNFNSTPSQFKKITINVKQSAPEKNQERQKIQTHENNKNIKTKFSLPSNEVRSEDQKQLKSYIQIIDNDYQIEKDHIKQKIDEKGRGTVSPKYNTASLDQYATAKSNRYQSETISNQNLETLYFRTLGKINPMFHLLYSPSHSLNTEEKNSLLEAIKIDHKEKFFQLIRERQYTHSLKRQFQNHQKDVTLKFEELDSLNRELATQNGRLKQQSEWKTSKFKSMQNQIIRLYGRIKQLESSDKSKSSAINIMEGSFKRIKESYLEKCDELVLYKNYESLQQIIMVNKQNKIKNKYFQQLNKQGSKWFKVIKKIREKKGLKLFKLYRGVFQNFQNNRITCKLIKHRLKVKNKVVLQQTFGEWSIFCKLVKKQIMTIKIMNKNAKKQFIQILKANQAKRKVTKLKFIWADRHFYNIQKYKFMRNCKELRLNMQQKFSRSYNFYKNKIQKLYFSEIKSKIQNNILKAERVNIMYIRNMKERERIYMIQTMKANHQNTIQKIFNAKQLYQNKELQISFLKFRQRIDQIKFQKDSIKNIRFVLKSKNLKYMKKCFLKIKKYHNKIKKMGVTFRNNQIFKYLTYQKISFDYQRVLRYKRFDEYFKNLKSNNTYRKNYLQKSRQLDAYIIRQKHLKKLNFIKFLQVARLKGKNFVKFKTIQEMNYQMQINDHAAIGLLRETKEQLILKQKHIEHLKNQIQVQSLREMRLMDEKDDIINSFKESCSIMDELRLQIDRLKEELENQNVRYHKLALSFNESLALLHKKQQDFQWLYKTLKMKQEQLLNT